MAGVSLNSNLPALRAERKLSAATAGLGGIYARLASGQRINRASDDAAGLAISASLSTDTRVYTQAIRNVSDGISALRIAEGALEQLTAVSMRQKELAAQAANGTYSLSQRRAMNAEANALVEEFNRITQSTTFNGVHLTDKSLAELRVQAGYGADGSISFAIADALARTAGTGRFGARTAIATGDEPIDAALGDLNGDGILDMVAVDSADNKASVFIGFGDGTFAGRTSLALGESPFSVVLGDVNGDGIIDIVTGDSVDDRASVLLGKGDGTFHDRASFFMPNLFEVALGDVNGDGVLDLATHDMSSDTAGVLLGNGNGTFGAIRVFSVGSNPDSVALGDLDGDGALDMVTANGTSMSVLTGNGDGTFRAASALSASNPRSLALGDLNGDGVLDIVTAEVGAGAASVYLGRGDGTFKDRVTYATGANPYGTTLGDLNGDGILDFATANRLAGSAAVLIGKGDGSFMSVRSFAVGARPYNAVFGDLNGDGALDIVTPDRDSDTVSVLLAGTAEVTTAAVLNICTREGALEAMDTIDATLQRISAELGAIGSTQSRFSVTLNTLSASRENSAAAAGRIMDADVAKESADLVRTQILQQAASGVLAQANQQPAIALQLLA